MFHSLVRRIESDHQLYSFFFKHQFRSAKPERHANSTQTTEQLDWEDHHSCVRN